MNSKRPFAAALAVLLTIFSAFPTFAQEPTIESELSAADGGSGVDFPVHSQSEASSDAGLPLGLSLQADDADELWLGAWLDVPDGEPYGLYGLCFILEDTVELSLAYSFDGENFELLDGKTWGPESWAEDGFLPFQLLIGADEFPLADFLSGEQEQLFVRMCAVGNDGSKLWTEALEIILDTEGDAQVPILEMELVEGGGAPGLYGVLDSIPENTDCIHLEYSFGGETYYFLEGFQWDLSGPLKQLCIPIDTHPLTAYLSGAVNSLYVRLVITRMDVDVRTEAMFFTHGGIYPPPEFPPPFTAELRYVYGGYQVEGHFEQFPPDVVNIRSQYSLDGMRYHTVDAEFPNDWDLSNLGTSDEHLRFYLENQVCVTYDDEPLKSYVAGKLDRFYIRLEITTETDVYQTQAAVFDRTAAQPFPEAVILRAAFPYTMRPLDEIGNPLNVAYGQYQVTVRENASPEDVAALLPDTLPIEVQLYQTDTGELLTSGIARCQADWKPLAPLELAAGQALTIPNAAGVLTVPAGAEIATPLGSYHLEEPLTFTGPDAGEVQLVLNAVGLEEAPDISLQQNNYQNAQNDIGALSLAFRQKPSGATAIRAYSFVEGDEEWTELCNLLALRDVDHNQAAALYGYVTILRPGDALFDAYLNEELPGFCIGLAIEGGVFDGERVILPWPGEYDPPTSIPEPGGSEGNENDAGSNGGSGDSTEGGQRPSLSRKPPKDLDSSPVIEPPSDESAGDGLVPEETESPEPVSNADSQQLQEDTLPQSPTAVVPSPAAAYTAEESPDIPPGNSVSVSIEPAPTQQTDGGIPAIDVQDGNPAESALSGPVTTAQSSAPLPSGQTSKPDAERTPSRKTDESGPSLPVAAAAAIVLVGGGIAVVAGIAATRGTTAGGVVKTLRRLIFRR